MKQFFKGANYFFEGMSLAKQPALRAFLIVPFIVNILFFSGASVFLFYQMGQGAEYLTAWLPDWLDWLVWLLWPVMILALLIVVFQTFTLIGNILMAPFNGLLAEKVAKLLEGDASPEPLEWKHLMRVMAKSFKREFHKLSYILIRFILLCFLLLIPGINLFAAILWVIYGAWMMAVEYIDYSFDNKGSPFREAKLFLKQHRLLAFGFGLTVLMFSLIPIINFFVMPVAVVAGTLLAIKR